MIVKKSAHKALHFLDEKISSPEQRLFIGGTALFIQPIIDFSNTKVDERTRQSSASRSIARAVIGTITGFIIRKFVISVTEKYSKKEGDLFFTKALEHATETQKKNYHGIIGTTIAVGIMLFTNFLLDVPGTNWMQNLIMDNVFNKGDKKHE